jgi:signal transduction histidine kinase
VVLIFRDITERREAEEALRKIEKARQEKLVMLGQLAGGVGHELSNPLGAIKNATYFLKMALEETEPEIKETLDVLDKEINTSEVIINSLLGFARPKLPLFQKVNVNILIQEILTRTEVPENIKINRNLNENLPTISGDPDQISHVFRNIILNAVQAMGDGGQLTIKTNVLKSESVSVSIKDTGIGISKENMKNLFEPLFTTKAKGIGLGLAISIIMVENHGGTIKAESELGKGSIFAIELPIKGKGEN